MDKSTVLGLVVGLGAAMATVMAEGGHLEALLNLPAALIVFGGTLGAVLVSHPMARLANLPRVLGKAFAAEGNHGRVEAIDLHVRLAEKARREGLLALEQDAGQVEDPFARKGLLMVVDGSDPEMVRGVMEKELVMLTQRHHNNARVLEDMGGYAPTMGIIGTVMGLVNVLNNLSDPSGLGASISTAFLATLYGVASANLIWLPLASKLKAKSEVEVEAHRLTFDAVLAIQAGDNPRIVREKLEVHLSPQERAASAKRQAVQEAEEQLATV